MAVTINGTTGMPASAAQFLIGQVCHFAMATPPAGFLPCDGQLISRTAYAGLFAAMGTLYGVGDGSTTFKLPDLRGEFIRGVDKGRGVDSGRVIGSQQMHQMQGHTHNLESWANQNGNGANQPNNAGYGLEGPYGGFPIETKTQSGNVGLETRPRNIAMVACIFTGVM